MNFLPTSAITPITIGSFLFLLATSALRHFLFHSSAWDLGIFDQAVYLISQGIPPISSFTGFHMLGDHAAWILYPLALLYKIYPSLYWLLGVQAFCLAWGAFWVWKIACQAELLPSRSILCAVVYLLYPLVLNINLFDFHPETIAIPSLLISIWAARANNLGVFLIAIGVITGCKAVLALTLIAMGIWLLFWEGRQIYGILAIIIGVFWFVWATQGIMPFFAGPRAVTRFLDRYSQLGGSWQEILQNAFWQPWRWLGKIFSLGTLEYFGLLFAPLLYIFLGKKSWSFWAPLVSTVPTLLLNIFADDSTQRGLIHQYSVPIVPFLLLLVVQVFQNGDFLRDRLHYVFLWASLSFLILSRLYFFGGEYLNHLDTWQATRSALKLVDPTESVLTTAEIAPHLSHRSVIHLAITAPPPENPLGYHTILLQPSRPSWLSTSQLQYGLIGEISKSNRFYRLYEERGVYLFTRSPS